MEGLLFKVDLVRITGTNFSKGAVNNSFNIRRGEDDLVLSHGSSQHVPKFLFRDETIAIVVIDIEGHWKKKVTCRRSGGNSGGVGELVEAREETDRERRKQGGK